MANQTFRELASLILLRCPSAPLTLAQSWIQSSFRDLVEKRRWSWLLKKGQLFVYDQYTTGTATVIAGTQTVTLAGGGIVAAAHVGRQFRIGTSLPIVTITDKDIGLNTYTIDQVWWPSTQTAKAFSVYQAYVALPSDFHSFISVVDPAYGQYIPFGLSITKLDDLDPQRVAAGTPRGLAPLDYASGVPRYELWPHQRSAAVYPIVYESRPTDPFDSGAAVPALLPADIILERAMMYCAGWPGTVEAKNPYFSSNLIVMHRTEYERRLTVLEKQDNEHMQQNIFYQSDQSSDSSISASWMQSHGPEAY